MGGAQEPDTLGPHPVLCTPPLPDGSVLREAQQKVLKASLVLIPVIMLSPKVQRTLASEISKLKRGWGGGAREPLANEDAAVSKDSGDHGNEGHRYNREKISRCWMERMAFS